MRSRTKPMVLALALGFAMSANAQTQAIVPPADPPSEREAEWTSAEQARLKQLESEVARLRRSVDERAAHAPPTAKPDPVEPPPVAAPPVAAPPVSLSGYLQADTVVYDQASVDQLSGQPGEPLNATRFLIRRARLRVDAHKGALAGALELDGNTVRGPQVRLIAAEIALKTALLEARLGLFKIPFGFEVQQKTPSRLFLEPATVIRALFPGDYDLGLQLSFRWRFLRAQLAAMNGAPIGERQFPGRDPNQSKDVVGRLGIETNPLPSVRVEAGFSGVHGTGFHAGTAATKDAIVWRDANENGRVELTELQSIPGSAATASENFDRTALGADVRMKVDVPRGGALRVYGEWIQAQNLDRGLWPADPVSAGRRLREVGFVVGTTLELPVGAVAGVRWDRYNPDADATDLQGADLVPKDASFETLSCVLGWRYREAGTLLVEYDRNRNALGRTVGGLPATLGSDTVTIRVQGAF